MSKFILTFSIFCSSLYAFSWPWSNSSAVQGSGVLAMKEFSLDSFVKIIGSGAFQLTVQQGKPQSVKVHLDDNLFEYLELKVVDSTLKIKMKENVEYKKKFLVELTVPKVEALELSGAISTELSGIKGETFRLETSGASRTRIKGEVESFQVELSGANQLHAYDFKAKRVSARISGSSLAQLFAESSLEADISGVSKVSYEGSPKIIKKSVTGVSHFGPRN
jgi:hypothetical protein